VKGKGEWRVISYMDQINAQSLKMVDERSLGGVRDRWFPHQSKSGVPSLCACFHYMFTDVAGASDDQNFAFLSHSTTSTFPSTPSLSHLCSAAWFLLSLPLIAKQHPKLRYYPFLATTTHNPKNHVFPLLIGSSLW